MLLYFNNNQGNKIFAEAFLKYRYPVLIAVAAPEGVIFALLIMYRAAFAAEIFYL